MKHWLRSLVLPCSLVSLALTPVPGSKAAEPVKSHGVTIHGELKYPSDFKHFDYANPNAPKGGEMKRATTGSFDNLNPFILKGRAAAASSSIYDSLMVRSADEAASDYGLLAESATIPADRTWVEFTLRQGAYWHDGKPITVDDVVFTFNILREKGHPQLRFYYQSVERIEKTGDRTVKFIFKPGDNHELPSILSELVVLPKHYWETREFNKTTLEVPLGSGPYKIESVDPGRSISIRRVENYWGKDLPVNVGRNNFDVQRVEYFRDQNVLIEAFKAGAYDMRLENSAKNWATAYDFPAVKAGVVKKEELKNERTQGMQGYAFNMRRPMFQDRKVREAIGYAYDFEWTRKTLFFGQYVRGRSYFQNSELEAKGLPSAVELKLLEPWRGQIPDEVFTKEYQPPKTDGSGNNRDNLRRAAELLKEASWVIKDGKLTNAKGEAFAFEILLQDPVYEGMTLTFVQNLKRLGIEARVRTVDSAQYQRRSDDFDFDVTIDSWGQSESPGNEQRDMWSSAAADEKGSRNSTGIKSKAIDALIDAIISAPDRKSLVERTHALDRVLRWSFLVVPQMSIETDRIAYWDKFGRPAVTPKQGPQVDMWWVDKEKAATLAQRKAAAGN